MEMAAWLLEAVTPAGMGLSILMRTWAEAITRNSTIRNWTNLAQNINQCMKQKNRISSKKTAYRNTSIANLGSLHHKLLEDRNSYTVILFINNANI